ncbi:chitobiase/beta-hexosaminidase C-terminal domain-containing protein [Paenibacillus pasadenensis]|uniref:chitobiase/beta-hexosaminidase C-terminal domain-containing protein n=1 Tax=Paenibacillus pasadenensis TaxID=217090 RepID=UPI000C7A7E61|nr:chitobiase/beta-hexosaminidase C-terminal domain-containing protein [Paenibacillus pasadenensis]
MNGSAGRRGRAKGRKPGVLLLIACLAFNMLMPLQSVWAADDSNGDSDESIMADFNFEDPVGGLEGSLAKVTVHGTPSYEDSYEGGGKAANLSNNFWLELTKQDGTPLLAGMEEITVSYDSKPDGGSTWAFFAAPNAETQNYLAEHYIGILDRPGFVGVERFNNNGSRPEAAEAETSATRWKHVDVVITMTETKLFVDGTLKSTVTSPYPMSSVLTESGGILQLGKGNWGGGEYFAGLIDNFKMYSRALSEQELLENRLTSAPPTFSPSEGQAYAPIAISHPAGEQYIHYTTDGSTPTAESPTYAGPIPVHGITTIKAVAISAEGKSSAIASADFYGSDWSATATGFRLDGQSEVVNAKIAWPLVTGADYYEVYRGDQLISRTYGDVADEYGLETDQDYTYTVKAIAAGATIAEASTNALRTFGYDAAAITHKKINTTGADSLTNGIPYGVKSGNTWYDYVYESTKDEDTGVVTTGIYEQTSADGLSYGSKRLLGSFEDMRAEGAGYTLHPDGKVVFTAHEEGSFDYQQAKLFIASVTPGGNDFEATFRARPFDMEARDMVLFVDDDDTAYVLFATRNNNDIGIVRLNDSWEQPEALVNTAFVGKHKESPTVIKHEGRYYFFGSTANGWYPSQAEYASATSLDGDWTPLRPIGNGSSFATQANGTRTWTGTGGQKTFALNGYHWGDQYPGEFRDPMGTYSRLFPMVFHDGIATADWFHQLDYDPAIGAIPVQSGQLLSLGKKAVDSEGLDATAVTDGADFASSPRVQHKAAGYNIVIDLAQASQLSEINFTTREVGGSDTAYRFKLEGSMDNANWTLLTDGSQNNVVGFVTNPVTDESLYRYVRLTVDNVINVFNGNSAIWADGIIELSVYGTPHLDKTALQAKYAAHKDTERGTFTNGSWNTITEALRNAEAVLNDSSATQWTIDRALQQLDEAFTWAQNVHPDKVVDYAAAGVPVGELWYDTEGNPIQAHGGGFLQQTAADGNPIYYWVGENKIHNQANFHAVSLYSSRDLVNWTNEGDILNSFSATVPGAEFGLIDNKWERPKLLYNEKTQKYVLYGHWETASSYASSQIAVATADSPEGPYTFLGHWRPGGTLRNWRSDVNNYSDSEYFKAGGVKAAIPASVQQDESQMGYLSRDFTVFADDDGTAYLMSAEGHSMRVHRLNEDYTDVDFTTYEFSDSESKATDFESYSFYEDVGREAPAVVRTDDGYYMASSGQSGWMPNQGTISYSADLRDPHGWTPVREDGKIIEKYAFGNNSTYYSQPTNIMKLTGADGTRTYVYMGDKWRSSQLSDSRYVWLPIEFEAEQHTASMKYTTGWKLNAATGGVQMPQAYLVSQGKSATITGNDEAAGIEKANDGYAFNLHTSGDSSSFFELAAPYEYTIDLGAIYDLSRIDVAYRLYNGSEMYHRYQILASNDNANWTELVNNGTNMWAGFNSDTLSGLYRYVKLKVNEVRRVNNNALSNAWGSGLVEVQVYANSADPYTLTPPSADLASGTYSFPQSVKLSHDVEDAQLYYTLDGSTPTLSSTPYAGAIELPVGMSTLKAIAIVNGVTSGILEASYTVEADRGGLEDTVLSLTGPANVVSNQTFEVAFGLRSVTDSVYAKEYTINYDPAKLEFIQAEPLKPGYIFQLETEVAPGQVRVTTVEAGGTQTPDADVAQLKLQFKAKALEQTVTGSVYTSDVILADGTGLEAPAANGATYSYVLMAVSKSSLAAAVADAQARHDAATEGDLDGQYPAGAKAALQAAIDQASVVLNDDTAETEDVQQAMIALNEAVEAFEALKNVPSVPVAGDLNGDGRVGIEDLSLAAARYGKKAADTDWSSVKAADLNGDNVIDIKDLRELAKLILS